MFVDKLKLTKGSDASNAHDEEPGEDEVEFSDDERESAYKRMLKERFFLQFNFPRPGSHQAVYVRRGSRVSSRAATPGASARRDHDYFDDTFRESSNPYDEHGAYDMNYGAGPSRPPPIPYDDPYSDSFTSITTDGDGEGIRPFDDIRKPAGRHDSIRPGSMGLVESIDGSGRSARASDMNSDPGPRHHNTRGRGRGGGRNRQFDRGRRGRGKGTPQHPRGRPSFAQQSGSYGHPDPTHPSDFAYGQPPNYGDAGEWSYGALLMAPHPPAFGFGSPNALPGVQPHINPRFAGQLGFNFPQASQMPQMSPRAGLPSPSEQYHPGDANLRSASGHQWEEESG